MRLVFDTNVLIAAFVARGACTELFEHCLIAHTAITSKAILNEFSRVLRVKFKATAEEIKLTLELLELRMVSVTPKSISLKQCRDKADLHVLGTAVAGKCRCIITGDKDLLVLKSFRGIEILKPSAFWGYEQNG